MSGKPATSSLRSPFEPEKSLYRTQSIGELLEIAAKELPEMSQDGVEVGVLWKEGATTVVGTVQIKDLTGQVVASMTKEGEKSLLGRVKWTF